MRQVQERGDIREMALGWCMWFTESDYRLDGLYAFVERLVVLATCCLLLLKQGNYSVDWQNKLPCLVAVMDELQPSTQLCLL